jgi:hypothetical protein
LSRITSDCDLLPKALEIVEDALRVDPNDPDNYFRNGLAARIMLQTPSPCYDLGKALEYLLRVTRESIVPPSKRLNLVRPSLALAQAQLRGYESIADVHEMRELILLIYRCLIDLLPLAATFSQEPEARLRELATSEQLGVAAALHALELGKADVAVEVVEQARSVFWQQALRTRSPLEDIPPALAEPLKIIFRDLEAASTEIERAKSLNQSAPLWADQSRVDRRRKGVRAEQLLEDIRALDGNQHFMKGQPWMELASVAAENRHVIVLLGNKYACCALVIKHNESRPLHVPLNDMNWNRLRTLSSSVKDFGLPSRDITSAADLDRLSMGRSRNTLETSDKLLMEMWHAIVKPVIEVLGLKVSSTCIVEKRKPDAVS